MTSSRILRDSNGDIGEHLRNHIHLTNCIHLKNHMHKNKQSSVLTDRSLLMRDLVVLQRSRSLRDPSASPDSHSLTLDSKGLMHKEGRRRSVDQNVVKKSGLRLSNSSPMVNFGTSKVTPSDEMFEGSSRKGYRAEDANEVYSVASVKSKNRVVNDATVKTLSDQLNEVLGDSDDLVSCKRRNARKRRRFRGTRRAARKVNVRDSAGNHKREVSRGEEEDEEEEEDREQNMNRAAPRNGCGIPFNWSRIHHRGRTFLDIAGRSLSCGISDPKGRKSETDMRMLSDSSSSFTKSDREAVPLLVDSAGNEEGWEHDYSGELGLFADDLLKNGKDSDFGNRRNARRHQSFTQKYSPRTFRDLVGQSLTVQALSNAVAKQRVGLLYVFHGPNGTGKTSCARTFARALNCHSTELSRPCGRCSSCVSYDNGKNRNIREMGPVKNFDFERLSDDMMMISQQKRQHLVFIFDDCDSMSTHCWNSLSKIVDGAPRRVAFVLVCSSLDALPHIVVSRCQRFFFTKLKDADIVDSLQRIASKEEIDIDEDALKLVASKSDGSLRDAEMTLEQLSLLGTRISVPLVQEMVGLISDEKLVDLLDLALSADTVNTVKNLRILMETGVEPLAIMSQLATVITDILAGSYDLGKEQHRRKFFRRQPLTKKDMEKLRQALKTLSESEKQLRVSNDKLTWLTAALLQLAPDQRCSSSADASFNRSPLMQDLNPSNKAAAEGFRDCNGQGLSSKKRPSVEDIWLAVLDKVRVSGLREFLYREAKIFSISIGSAPTVQLMFDSLLGKSTAESFEDHILRAFEAVLGSPVTLEMRTESKKDARNASLSPFHDLNSRERFRESGRSEIVELDDESESGMTRVRRKHLEASKNQNQNQNQSIVRGKVSLAQVIMQAEGNSWPKHKAVSVADKLEHDNLRLESRSRSLICWKASRSARSLKLWRLKVRTRRVRLHSLLKLVSCGNNLSTRSPSR
ncbi:unnamed protein product [Thlaspi arvense]|uniref:AAA+ ATPase domain-containing protein n=1 Tax=Thlaspi arvense TaxID=13288 RepID=A0AAU9RSU4_THLAR|nr:unnamed protein product [Thlaspi arvense]